MRSAVRQHHNLDLPPHPRFAGFEAFAAREIFPWLAGQEAERRRTVRRVVAIVAGTAAGIALVHLLIFALYGGTTPLAIVFLGIVPAVIAGAIVYFLLANFRADLKDFLLPKVCDRLKLRYMGASSQLPVGLFVATGMLPDHNRHNIEDGVESEAAGTVFEAAEARFQMKKGTGRGSTLETVWRGLLMAARAKEPFAGLTLVMPARGFVARLFDERPHERIELGLGELEAGLEVRTTLAEEARRVLTERVMRSLADLAHRLGRERPSLALMGEQVLLAVESKRDRFEAGSLWKPLDDPKRIEDLLWELGYLCELAEALGAALRLERAPGARMKP
jgi:hypothetical protein